MASGGRGPPRPPRSWKGLLKFCMEITQSEDTTQPSQFTEMDPERRQWLREAMDSMTRDPVRAMLDQLKILSTGGEAEKNAALEELTNYCEDLDLSADFFKIGGGECLVNSLESEFASVRSEAANLTATLAQNNPWCQNVILQLGLMPKLLMLLDNDPSVPVRTKALYAISALTRGYPEGQAAFMKDNGPSTVLRALQTTDERLRTKAAFLIRNLSQEENLQATLRDMGLVEQVLGMLLNAHDSSREHLLGTLLNLVDSASVSVCQRSEFKLKETLTSLTEKLDPEQNLEEIDFCQQLLKVCFRESSFEGER